MGPVIPAKGRVPLPVVPLPEGIKPDPVRQWVCLLLEAGCEPARVWPAESAGFAPLLPGHKPSSRRPGQKKAPAAAQQLQEALRLSLAGDPSAPQSATVVHADVEGWLSDARGAICTSEWFLNPAQAVVICANQIEADEALAQLHQAEAHQGNQDDPFDSARLIAEEMEAPYPGWKFDGTSPVRLAGEVGPDDRWNHVYLSPGCRSLSRLELLPAVHSHPISLHFVDSVEREPPWKLAGQ